MLYIFLAVIFYTIALMLLAFSSRLIHSNLVVALVNSISAVIPVILIIFTFNKKFVENGRLGIITAILAGIAITFYTLAFNKSLQVNKVALVAPVVFGGAIFLTAILSYFIFKEKLSPLHTTGLTVVIVGMIIIIYSAATGK